MRIHPEDAANHRAGIEQPVDLPVPASRSTKPRTRVLFTDRSCMLRSVPGCEARKSARVRPRPWATDFVSACFGS
jgi:hypothetical protein